MYKLIAVDMDGTLLREDKTISEETIKAINRAKAKGIKVVLATGRPLEGIEKYLEELNLIRKEDYALTYNGAIVQNTLTKKVISNNLIKGSDLKYLYKLSKELKINIHAFDKSGCITPVMSKYTELEGTINKINVNLVDFNTIKEEEDIIKVMMVEEPEKLEEAIAKLPKELYDEYTIVRSAPYFLEFLNKQGNKGEGVRMIAQYLGIKQEEVICVGDAGNDVHMIKYAGLGVAMGNAFDEVKEIADFITKTNEEDGVAHVINKFILKAS
ncbi:sugar-phosphatase [Desnuesiella massiliensis]|uniref:sugar-phosphatase n=1 Tax=Desnuesiella massiliensis TaxID=1650662 RepID=UPI0006E14D39|nr:sugar-phosphatase [Desnuesiella massiliensis]